jgi:Sulfotransferase family
MDLWQNGSRRAGGLTNDGAAPSDPIGVEMTASSTQSSAPEGSNDLALDEPVIVLTGARSGSTLLRMILDAHPDLACPPETNIPKLCTEFSKLIERLYPASGASSVSDLAMRQIKSLTDTIYSGYLTRRGKRRWCDKSLLISDVGEPFLELYDKAKFICLYRHSMDFIHSAIDASPWGLRGYGFDNYARGTGGTNSVAAMAAYWIDNTAQTMEFERTHAERCLRVHYEELVTRPGAVADRIFDFIGVSRVPGIERLALAGLGSPDAYGPGDHKIFASDEINDRSVGRGIRVPPELMPSNLLSAMNSLLGRLGYAPVDRGWQTSTYPPTLLRLAADDDGAQQPAVADDADPEPEGTLAEHHDGAAFDALDAEIMDRAQRAVGTPVRPRRHSGTCAIVAYTVTPPRAALAWRVDWDLGKVVSEAPVEFQDLDVDWVFAGEIKAWGSVLRGDESLPALLRAGLLRCVGRELLSAEGDGLAPPDEVRAQSGEIERRTAAVMDLLLLGSHRVDPS